MSETTYIPKLNDIESFSGRYVDLSDPRPETITLEDVAHGLANTCRYNGQARRFYSVAEHAVAVSERLEHLGYGPVMCLAGLHHDDAEAFLGDVTRPLKSLLQPAYGELTQKMDTAIFDAINLHEVARWLVGQEDVKQADDWALLCEAYHLLPSRGAQWGSGQWGVGAADFEYIWQPACLNPADAEGLFLSRHWSLI